MSVFRRIQVGEYIFESAQDGVVAHAGGGQTNAFDISPFELTRVATVATAGDSIKLPPAQPGLTIVLVNHGANTMQVFGQSGDTIDDAATATGVPQMKNSWVMYTCFTAGAWYTEGLASGFQALFGGAFSTQSTAGPLTAGATHTAVGGTQITANQVLFGAVSTTTDSATLPPAKAGMQIAVLNNGGNSLQVWCATGALGGTTGGDTVNGVSTTVINIATSVTPTVFYCFNDGAWFSK